MSGTFEYCGYHFTPYRKFERCDGDNLKIMQRVRTDWELSLFTYDNRKADYTYEGFYAASTDKQCDLFRCEENGKIYVPCLNELFIYPEPPKQRNRYTYLYKYHGVLAMNKNELYSTRKYNSIANDYDTSFDGKFTAKFKQKVLELCEVSDGDKVLDVGCGNGRLIHQISRKGNIFAYGVDISPGMIEECRRLAPNIVFQVSTGEKPDFENGLFDTLTICCVLHHLNDPQKFFVEAQRVLRIGGTLIVAEPWMPVPFKQLTDWVVSPLLRAGDNKLFSHVRLKRLFESYGFSITEVYTQGFMQIVKGRKT